jgi:rhamnulokinase
VLVQARGLGVLSGGLPELRKLLRSTQDAQLYLPTLGADAAWATAGARVGLN